MTRTAHRPLFNAFAATVLMLAATHAAAQPASAKDPRGRWITASGNLEVEVAPCGNALCGTATKVLGNRSMSREGAEMAPADDASVIGSKVLRDFAPVVADAADGAPGEWAGEIYNRENGKTYRSTVRVSTDLKPEGELLVHPYIGLPLFGKTQRWQRADGVAR
jgi:uncharacterized protein (DUF2147 family)